MNYKVIGILVVSLAASVSAWPLASLFGLGEPEGQPIIEKVSDEVILNYDAGDHKHVQTGKAGEEVHGIFSVDAADGKTHTTSYKADKEGFKADVIQEEVKEENKEAVKKDKDAVEQLKKEGGVETETEKLEKTKEEVKDSVKKVAEDVEKKPDENKKEEGEKHDLVKKVDEKLEKKKEEEGKVEKDSVKNKVEEKLEKKPVEKEEVKVDKDSVKKVEEKEEVKAAKPVKKEEEKIIKTEEPVKKDEGVKSATDEKKKPVNNKEKESVKKGEAGEKKINADEPLSKMLAALLAPAHQKYDDAAQAYYYPYFKQHNSYPYAYYPHAQFAPLSAGVPPFYQLRNRRSFYYY